MVLKTMIDPAMPASVRVLAAECVMNQATKAIEIEDIEAAEEFDQDQSAELADGALVSLRIVGHSIDGDGIAGRSGWWSRRQTGGDSYVKLCFQ